MNKFFAIIGGCVVVILTALFAAPSVIDWSRYRSTFEDQATRLLGRPVRVGDHVRVQLLPSPYVSLENVRIADASGHFDTPLLRAESFHMQLAIGALLTGSLVAQDIEMASPNLRLAINADGQGNWTGLGGRQASPATSDLGALALNAVHITHGSVELVGATGLRTHLDDISGDIDAPALSGPYHFKGQLANDGKPIDLRFMAGREAARGDTRLKVFWHETSTGAASYALDGTLAGLETAPKLTGTISVQQPAAAGTPAVPLDVKASIEATADRAKLDNVEILFEAGDRPQRITGTALFDWHDESASAADLTAVWLDLDKLAGLPPAAGPLAIVRKLVERLDGTAGLLSQMRLRLNTGELALGGSSVNDLTMVARSNGHGFTIESLAARLPGLSRVNLSGDLTGDSGGRFAGDVRLWGANIAGLANWAIPGAGVPDKGSASTFLIDGAIAAEPGRFRADHLRTEISGTSVTGSIAYSVNEPRSVTLALDAGRLDLAKLLDGPIAAAALSAMLTPPSDADKGGAGDAWSGFRQMLGGDAHLDLRIGHLLMAQGALKDISAKLDRSNGRLEIPAIDLSTDAGVVVHAEGALQTKGDTGLGQLRLTLEAPDVNSVRQAMTLAGSPDLPDSASPVIAALTPLRLAGTLQLGASATAEERLQMDGLANGSRLSVTAERDGADNDWLGTRLDLAADLDNSDDGKLLAQLANALGATVTQPAKTNPARLSLRLSGVPEEAMVTSAELASQAVHAQFDGTASVGGKDGVAVEGAVTVEAARTSDAVALARLDRFIPAIEGPLKFAAHASLRDSQLVFSDARASAAGETAMGEARLDVSVVPSRLAVRMSSNSLRLDHLLARLVATQAPPTGPKIAAWSDQPFNFSPYAGLEAKVDAVTGKLVLGQGLSVSHAELSFTGAEGGIEVALTSGHLAGGDITGRGQLIKASAGASFTLEGSLTGADLDSLAGTTTGLPLPRGKFGLSGRLEGRGLSPHDIAASAAGNGAFSLSEGGIAGLSPLGIDMVAHDVLADPTAQVTEADLRQRLDRAREAVPFPMLGARGALTIAEGAAKFDKLKIESSKAELEIANRLDLATLRLTSSWTMRPKSPRSDEPALAPVQFTFEGPLAGFAMVPPVIDATALAADLTNRKLLGSPGQVLGLWPQTPRPATAPADVPEPSAATPPRAAPAELAGMSTPTAAVTTTISTASVPAAAGAIVLPGEPGAAATTASSTGLTAAPADATPTASAKPAPAARGHRKKTNWATALLQSLFGN